MATTEKSATWLFWIPFVAVFLWLVLLIILVETKILIGPSPPYIDQPDLDTIIEIKRTFKSTIIWSGVMSWIFTAILFFSPFLLGFNVRRKKSFIKTGSIILIAVPILFIVGAFSLYLSVGGATPDHLAISLFVASLITVSSVIAGIILITIGFLRRRPKNGEATH